MFNYAKAVIRATESQLFYCHLVAKGRLNWVSGGLNLLVSYDYN